RPGPDYLTAANARRLMSVTAHSVSTFPLVASPTAVSPKFSVPARRAAATLKLSSATPRFYSASAGNTAPPPTLFRTASRATPTARQARSLAQCWNAWHDHGFGFQETKGSGAASCPGLAESSIYAHAVPEAKHRGLRAPGLRGVRRGADQVRGDAARA